MYLPTFGLHLTIPDIDHADEWQTIVQQQASTLAVLLSRIETTAALLRQHQAPPAQRQTLAAAAERVLTAQAHQQVMLERELVALRALVMDVSTRPSALATRVQTLESAIEGLHANLTTAQQALAAVLSRGAIER